MNVELKKGNNSKIFVIILSLIVVLSGIGFFNILQDDRITILNDQNEKSSKVTELYLKLGPKHIPLTAVEIFKEYDINLELSDEEKEQITPLEDFFTMGNRIPEDTEKFAKNPDDYRLRITGNVGNSTDLTYEQLLTKFEIKYVLTELYCMPNLRGMGQFVGPKLYDIISYTNPNENATKIIVNAGDGYQWNYTLEEVNEYKDDYILAIAMNGYPLAIEHGYPARLALPHEPGLKWVKWVVEIKLE